MQSGRQRGHQKSKEKDGAIPDQQFPEIRTSPVVRTGEQLIGIQRETKAILCYTWVYRGQGPSQELQGCFSLQKVESSPAPSPHGCPSPTQREKLMTLLTLSVPAPLTSTRLFFPPPASLDSNDL